MAVGSADCAVVGQLAPGAYSIVCQSGKGQGSVMTELYVLPY